VVVGIPRAVSATGKTLRLPTIHLGDADPFTRPLLLAPSSGRSILAGDGRRGAPVARWGSMISRVLGRLNGPEGENTVGPQPDAPRTWVCKTRQNNIPRHRGGRGGTGFSTRMVRSLAGVLFQRGRAGKQPDGEVVRADVRQAAPFAVLTAPPQGIVLERVFYR